MYRQSAHLYSKELIHHAIIELREMLDKYGAFNPTTQVVCAMEPHPTCSEKGLV